MELTDAYTGAVVAPGLCVSATNGTYTVEVRIDASANSYPAPKGSWCRNYHPYVGTINVAY